MKKLFCAFSILIGIYTYFYERNTPQVSQFFCNKKNLYISNLLL